MLTNNKRGGLCFFSPLMELIDGVNGFLLQLLLLLVVVGVLMGFLTYIIGKICHLVAYLLRKYPKIKNLFT